MHIEESETGVQYRMNGTGRTGYVIFSLAMAMFTAVLIFCAFSSKSFDLILWLLIAGASVGTVVFARSALSDAWRITTHSWGFEVPDRDILRIPWEDVESYHYSDSDDSTQWVMVQLKPGANRQKPVGIDVTNLEPPVADLLRTLDRAIAAST